ncbi:hypothetical protein HBA92_17860 [Ochrobactrum sp. MR28]|nr:hypothetical protein [Ochrobactrum sp. MR28]MBX8818158.1 hypothetical protein [Ochrobactrum sp. MR31]
MRPEITTLLASRLRTRIEKQIKPVGEAGSQYILFFTFSDKKVVHRQLSPNMLILLKAGKTLLPKCAAVSAHSA